MKETESFSTAPPGIVSSVLTPMIATWPGPEKLVATWMVPPGMIRKIGDPLSDVSAVTGISGPGRARDRSEKSTLVSRSSKRRCQLSFCSEKPRPKERMPRDPLSMTAPMTREAPLTERPLLAFLNAAS